ncbi:hypothetical protein HK407_01g00090 [Ordospora pajunii]|jgi:hypothetical protein|uniref:uncharacterized protein n=1 Tax=Ordospora pajunii TaxID=3039483 RepID=UPI002952768B|nr:uncharacterized protein HK407_01g00090 [Ordospora pajunii]KAH9412118.1 hypothetical protein HK407_01g00090 [Ordospora pajunii]
MFCIACQRKFNTKKAYKAHAETDSHLKHEDEYSKNKGLVVERNTSNFITDFQSYISQIPEYKEMGQVYKEYLSKSRFRIEGTRFKSIEEVIERICSGISVCREDGKILVKQLPKIDANALKRMPLLNLERLAQPFRIRVVDRKKIRRLL